MAPCIFLLVCIDDRKSVREDGDALAIEATYFEHVGVNDGIMIAGPLHQRTMNETSVERTAY